MYIFVEHSSNYVMGESLHLIPICTVRRCFSRVMWLLTNVTITRSGCDRVAVGVANGSEQTSILQLTSTQTRTLFLLLFNKQTLHFAALLINEGVSQFVSIFCQRVAFANFSANIVELRRWMDMALVLSWCCLVRQITVYVFTRINV